MADEPVIPVALGLEGQSPRAAPNCKHLSRIHLTEPESYIEVCVKNFTCINIIEDYADQCRFLRNQTPFSPINLKINLTPTLSLTQTYRTGGWDVSHKTENKRDNKKSKTAFLTSDDCQLFCKIYLFLHALSRQCSSSSELFNRSSLIRYQS